MSLLPLIGVFSLVCCLVAAASNLALWFKGKQPDLGDRLLMAGLYAALALGIINQLITD